MKFKLPWKKNSEYAELESMESLLKSVYQPINPSKDFMSKLRTELVGKPKRKLFGLEIPNAKMGWILAGGILGTIAMVGNTTLSIFRFVKLIEKTGKKKKSHASATI